MSPKYTGKAKRPRIPITERRLMAYTLREVARDGLVYERDIPAWWGPHIQRYKMVRRVEHGVFELLVTEATMP